MAVEPVQALTSFFAHVDSSHFAEDAQVLGHLGLSQPERAHEVIDRALAFGENVEDLPPPGLGHCVERIRCGCRARHTRNHMLI